MEEEVEYFRQKVIIQKMVDSFNVNEENPIHLRFEKTLQNNSVETVTLRFEKPAERIKGGAMQLLPDIIFQIYNFLHSVENAPSALLHRRTKTKAGFVYDSIEVTFVYFSKQKK